MSGSSKRRRVIGLVLSLGVSVAILAYLLAELDWRQVATEFGKVNPWFIAVLLPGFFPLIWLRALRWKLLLPNREAISIPRLIDGTMIGFLGSTVLPLRAGEIIRPLVITRWQPVSFSAALASILVERLSDSICLLTLMLVCLSRVPDVPPGIVTGAKALLALSLVLIGIVVLSYILPGKVEKFFHRVINLTVGRFAPNFAGKLNEMVVEYFAGLRVISSLRQLAAVIVLSFTMWLLVAGWYQALLWAFGIYPSFWVGMVLNVMIALAVAVPSAPGFIGVFQAGCIIALSTVYGYSEEFAMAYSVVGHLMQMTFIVVGGMFVLHRRGLKFRQLQDQGD